MMPKEESLMTIGELDILKKSIFSVCFFVPALPMLLRQIPVNKSFEQFKAQGYFKGLICCFTLNCHSHFKGAAWLSS